MGNQSYNCIHWRNLSSSSIILTQIYAAIKHLIYLAKVLLLSFHEYYKEQK